MTEATSFYMKNADKVKQDGIDEHDAEEASQDTVRIAIAVRVFKHLASI